MVFFFSFFKHFVSGGARNPDTTSFTAVPLFEKAAAGSQARTKPPVLRVGVDPSFAYMLVFSRWLPAEHALAPFFLFWTFSNWTDCTSAPL